MSALANSLQSWLNPILGFSEQDQEQANTATRTGGSGEQEPVVVWEAANSMEARIVKGRLTSEGIPAMLRGEALGEIYGLTSGRLASTRVLVPAPLAEKARQILASDPDGEFETD